MYVRCKYVTNSSSSNYTLQGALRKLKEAEHLLFNARSFNEQDGMHVIPEIELIVDTIQAQVRAYKKSVPASVPELLARVREGMYEKD
jgi:hypothetical protein